MSQPVGRVLGRALGRIRPSASESAVAVDPVTLVGWYVRKGLLASLRGLVRRPLFREVRGVVFIGRRVSIAYPRRISLGASCYIGSGTSMTGFAQFGTVLGDRVTIRENGWIQTAASPADPGVSLRIGSSTYIGPGVIIGVGGPVDIGPDCQFGAGVTLIAENHETGAHGVDAQRTTRRGIRIGRGCWLGHRVTVVDGVTLGENCVVGAGAVVTKSFPDGTRLAGVPARPLGQVVP
jgi:acetyltransferase-like isoleucine patch superfamily enzyme